MSLDSERLFSGPIRRAQRHLSDAAHPHERLEQQQPLTEGNRR
jgi:hypothetical protein